MPVEPKSAEYERIITELSSHFGAALRVTYDSAGQPAALAISSASTRSLPPSIFRLLSLTSLALTTYQLAQIPSELGQLVNLQQLDLSNNQLTQVPSELGQLVNLQRLDLGGNKLAQVPPELGRLVNLQQLQLSHNLLTQVPAQLSKCANLRLLDLSGNRVREVPAQLGQLSNLQSLDISNNQLQEVPAELGQLNNLRELSLWINQLQEVPAELGQLDNLQELLLSSNQLREVPAQLGQLRNLRQLYLWGNHLREVPAQLGQLRELRLLLLWGNELGQIPVELGQLTNLEVLVLHENQLKEVPPELGQLANLRQLYLDSNKLTTLPEELGQLANLEVLTLSDNNITHLPPTLGHLANLQILNLAANPLRQLPPEIGLLPNLRDKGSLSLRLDAGDPYSFLLDLDIRTRGVKLYSNDALLSPPPEIVARGSDAVLDFLADLQLNSKLRYEAKLLILGQGGVGKTSLLAALQGKPFVVDRETTHGIDVEQLLLSHPREPHGTIQLNAWDFGGQEIYHATHQFFFSQRSIYMLLWNARAETEQGRLDYWLETIKAKAPDVPVLLVATHIDERSPDINFLQLRERYPQLVANLSVSNRNGTGLDELRQALALEAAALPQMGQPWPLRWLDAEGILAARPERYISAGEYKQYCAMAGIDPDLALGTLAAYLHDLGKILFFRDEAVLSNIVILKPNWLTRAIGGVLDDKITKEERKGILQHADLPRIWDKDENGQPYELHLYPIFQRLMEKFDLSYEIDLGLPGQAHIASLVPQLLPYEPPADLPPWPQDPPDGEGQVQMAYSFATFVPAGIMSWFIVRTHQYTMDLHWREGVMLEYQVHTARVLLDKVARKLSVVVRGPSPYNFFTILNSTIDLILERFPGLTYSRQIPCICHIARGDPTACPHTFSYETLTRRIVARRRDIDCEASLERVSLLTLLYGIHPSTTDQLLNNIADGQQTIIAQYAAQQEQLALLIKQVQQQSEHFRREFARLWNLEMRRAEMACPAIFYLTSPQDRWFDPRSWVSREYRLHLICQHPVLPHSVDLDGYVLRQSKEWWASVGPWIKVLIDFLKVGVPIAGAMINVYDTSGLAQLKADLGLIEKISDTLTVESTHDTTKKTLYSAQMYRDTNVAGAALRVLYQFLDEADKSHYWCGLTPTQTLDGNILWLCPKHQIEYDPRRPVRE